MTSTTIDLKTMPRNIPSLCIPRVFPNIDERRIRGVFDSLDMGEIERVDIIKRTTEKGENFNRVFIHWKSWNSSDNANQARERLLNGKEIKIVYDDPWFWKISAYREPPARHAVNRPPVNRPPVSISFDSDEDRRPRQQDDRRPRQQDDRRPRQQDDRRPRQQEDRRPRQQDDRRPRQQEDRRPRQQDDRRPRPTRKVTYKPRTPECSPPRIQEEDRESVMMMTSPEPVTLDYGNVPPLKKLNFKSKNPIIVEEEAKA